MRYGVASEELRCDQCGMPKPRAIVCNRSPQCRDGWRRTRSSMEILLILVLIMLNGVFAMSEMAVVSSRRARLQNMAEDKRPGAAAALALHNEPSSFLSTIQVGITLVAILNGAMGETVLADPLAERLAQYPSLAPHSKEL